MRYILVVIDNFYMMTGALIDRIHTPHPPSNPLGVWVGFFSTAYCVLKISSFVEVAAV